MYTREFNISKQTETVQRNETEPCARDGTTLLFDRFTSYLLSDDILYDEKLYIFYKKWIDRLALY